MGPGDPDDVFNTSEALIDTFKISLSMSGSGRIVGWCEGFHVREVKSDSFLNTNNIVFK
jgi:hypothetical protein